MCACSSITRAAERRAISASSASPADVMRVVDLNVRALTMVTQTVVPFMTRGAKIINVSSIAAFCPTPRMTVYSASKAYVSAFTGGHRRRAAPQGHFRHSRLPWPDED
ncbi:MAG: SDR family NAD(P)-dependent oxidoreductase [Acutalibacteraceae bacterium]